MTDQPTCPLCGHPIHDTAYVCRRCGDDLIGRATEDGLHGLRLLVRIAGDITLTVAKLDRIERGGAPEPDPDPWEKNPGALFPNPFPVALQAGTLHDAAVTQLSVVAREIAGIRGREITGPGHPLALLGTFLIAQVEWLRYRPEAEDTFKDIHDATQQLIRLVDRPPVQWYAGRCSCGEELLPTSGAKVVRCQSCGAEYDPDDRKAQMLQDLEEVWLTADQCSHAMTLLGRPVVASTVRTWADRGRLAPHPDSLLGRPRYRVGSVRELVEQMHADQRERTLRAAVKAAEVAERRARRLRPVGA